MFSELVAASSVSEALRVADLRRPGILVIDALEAQERKRAEDAAQTLENLRERLHGTDWRGYARINPAGSWPRKNMCRGGGELVAVLREEEERRT